MMITIGQEMSDGCVLSIIESGTETTRRWSLKANGGGGLSQHPKNFMRARIICGNGQTHESEVGVGQRPDRRIGRQDESTSFSARFVVNRVAAMDIKNCISSNVMRSFEHCKIHMMRNYLPACCVHHRIQGYDNLPCAGVVER